MDRRSEKRCTDPLELAQNSKKASSEIIVASTRTPKFTEGMEILEIPRCVSRWKNKRGVLVPIETRAALGAQTAVEVNTNVFREFNEALDKLESELNPS